MFDVAIVIGNGFDLNLGLRTGYNHFIEDSDDFNDEANSGDELFQFLRDTYETRNKWIDLEISLKEYFSTPQTMFKGFTKAEKDRFEKAKKSYHKLVAIVKKYLSSISKPLNFGFPYCDTNAFKLLKELKDTNFVVVNFNYTNNVEDILIHLGMTKAELKDKIIYPHGDLLNEIIIGIEDDADVGDNVFLKKSAKRNYLSGNVPEILEKARDIVFFGHTLGETDSSYFSEFFIQLAHSRNEKKGIFLNYYQEDGYDELMIQIDRLTNRCIGQFKRNCHFNSIDAHYLPYNFKSSSLTSRHPR